MKRYKVIEVIRMLLADGWEYCYTKGDHRQFKHPTKPGKVTVRGKERRGWRLQRMKGDHRQFVNDKHPGTVTISGKDRDTISQEVLNSIWKQAGWK